MNVLISAVVVVVILALVLWLSDQLPIAAPFKLIVRVLVVLIAILYLLSLLGYGPAFALRG